MKDIDGTLTAREAGHPRGGPVRSAVDDQPKGWVGGSPVTTILIHGYNNTYREANDAYAEFRRNLPDHMPGKLGVFYWPGDINWNVPMAVRSPSYPFEISDAKESAERLADFLIAAGQANPHMEFILVCHSLGCRLALETMHFLNHKTGLWQPRTRCVILMAAAVPVGLCETGKRLLVAARRVDDRIVLYSSDDGVLGMIFSLGQTAAILTTFNSEEGFWPEAVGKHGNPREFPSEPIDRSPNGHSDYWKDKAGAFKLLEKLGVATPPIPKTRSTPKRDTPRRRSPLPPELEIA